MELPSTPQRTTPGFAFSIVERSLRECIAERQFGKHEALEAAEFFEHECAFCGDPIERWDHLTPISAGGDTVLGNMVPACRRCDDSKQGHRHEDWIVSASPASPASRGIPDIDKRLERIRLYVETYSYRPRQPDERLDADELQQYEIIRRDLAKARADFDEFLAVYRERTGLT